MTTTETPSRARRIAGRVTVGATLLGLVGAVTWGGVAFASAASERTTDEVVVAADYGAVEYDRAAYVAAAEEDKAERDRLEAERVAAEQAAAAEAARVAAEAAAAAQAAAEAEAEESSYEEPVADGGDAPASAEPIKCPAGSRANSGDGLNDTSCLPEECFYGTISPETHPQCMQPFRP